jgi:iron complex transport system substrate-binding protein
MRKIIFLLALFLVVSLSGCTQPVEKSEKSTEITDLAGRIVEVPEKVERIVAVGPGALRLVVYLNATEKVVGIEDAEAGAWEAIGRPYIMAHPELSDLPVIGKAGPNPVPNAEKIIEINPDVIFITGNPELAEDLQKKTGIPTVFISYGTSGGISEELVESLRLMGEILDRESRSEEVVSFIESVNDDLMSRTKDITEKPSVYAGAISFKGGHGIESTQADFPPFLAVNVDNVAGEINKSGAIFIDREKLLEWNPDIIFIDLGNIQLVKADYEKNSNFYNSLKAFEEGRVYGILPFNYYWTNIEIALADAYYIGKVVYPEAFDDINPEEKADEIFEFFVGEKLYDEFVDYYGGFRNLAGEFK